MPSRTVQPPLQLLMGCNRKYFISAVNLIESFWRFHPGAHVHFFWFDLPPEWLVWLRKWGGQALRIEEIPQAVPHAHEATMFYWKSWLLKEMASRAGEDAKFLYLDVGTEIKAPLEFIDRWLSSTDNLFVTLRNKIGDWTTLRCLFKLSANAPEYTEADQVHANVIGFRATERIRKLFTEWEAAMCDVEVAGPTTRTKRPDGAEARCAAHRADQSALSILLIKHGFAERPDDDESRRHVYQSATSPQTVLCHRMRDRTSSLRLATWVRLVAAGIIPCRQALSAYPSICLLRTPRLSFAWFAQNYGKYGVRRRLKSVFGLLPPSK